MTFSPTFSHAAALIVLAPILLWALAIAIGSRLMLVLALVVTMGLLGTWALTGRSPAHIKLPDCITCGWLSSTSQHIREGPRWPLFAFKNC